MLTLTDIATLAERTLQKNGRLDPIFIFEGTKDIQTREFPNLPEPALLDLMDALGFSFAYDDQFGDLVHLFFMCETWLNKKENVRAVDDPHRFEGIFVYQKVIQSGMWEVACYQILYDQNGKPSELKTLKSPVSNDVVIGHVIDRFLRGFRRGLATKKAGL